MSILLAGVLATTYTYVRDEKPMSDETRFWGVSIVFAITSYLLFTYGTATTTEAIKSNSIVFSFANSAHLASIFFQLLFCWSLNKKVPRWVTYAFLVLIIGFGIRFEYLRGSGNFVGRVLEMAVLSSAAYIFAMFWLIKAIRTKSSIQLTLLFIFTLLELLGIGLRLAVAATQVNPVQTFGEIPFLLIAALWLNLTFNILSYLTMAGYWSERAIARRAEMRAENERIRQLLEERDQLVSSLLVANKSATAGALSASIAHELNQPIGASRINFFTLKKILTDQGVNDEVIQNLLNRMEIDNKRVADIVSTLRSIFTQNQMLMSNVDLSDVVGSVVGLIKAECDAQNIQLSLNIPKSIVVRTSAVGLQQVLLNIINNAIQALGASDKDSFKRIRLSTRQTQNGFIDVLIEDSGPGIDAKTAANLFNLFATQKTRGMGVGLWLSKYIIEYCGGRIDYEPVKTGGSRFCVVIQLS